MMKQKIDRSLTRATGGDTNLKLGTGRDPRDRVFHPGPAADLCRQEPAPARTQLAQGPGPALRRGADQTRGTRSSWPTPTVFCAPSNIASRWCRSARPTTCRPAPRNCAAWPDAAAFGDAAEFGKILEAHRERVTQIFRDLFYTSEEELPAQVSPEVALLFDPAADPDLCKDILEEKGFRQPGRGLRQPAGAPRRRRPAAI